MTNNKPVFLALAFLVLLSCNSKVPVILSIDPKIGGTGEEITLGGYGFGEERGESYVTIAGTSPTNSSYHLWQDDLIKVRVPESGESGLVYVHVKGKKSNGVLFSNSAAIPRPVAGEEPGFEPKIVSVSPQAGAPGTLITITGSNFGHTRENAGVFFSWDFESSSASPFVVREREFIEVSETELGYESWNTREIKVRLPDGAVNGNLEIRTPRGKSLPALFDVSGRPGTKSFKDKRSYTISYSVDVRVLEATRPNTLYLWIPRPVNSPYQRNIALISRNVDPFVENHRTLSLFKLDNLGAGTSRNINLSFNVEVYAQETGIRPLSVKQEQNPSFAVYMRSSPLIPCDDPKIKAMADTITGRERNPYIKARLLYEWIIWEMKIVETLYPPLNSIVTAMEQKRADSYTAALLYTAMARASGVPCIPSAGVLINRNGQTLRHYWAEFWINDFGWIPVDPAMGAGAVPASFIVKQDRAAYYFGNMDNMRIAFSRGELTLSRMESRGRLVSHPQSYSLQNIWEEAAGGLESYSSLWGDITITGMYMQ
ncbi:MAG: IPT/TIG domain-containing protein [Treponema sp.]|jgi:transglutaminase-like putative cysteine protease|nr:IPT/TIG domain-containing protein [Treponema sp.]